MSVDRTIVRLPLRALSSAVAAAMLVLPTPPLPVYRRIRVMRPNRTPGPASVHDPGVGPKTAPGYAFLDAGDGRRLERFGEREVDRTAPWAIDPRQRPTAWGAADLRFDRSRGWSGRSDASAAWQL